MTAFASDGCDLSAMSKVVIYIQLWRNREDIRLVGRVNELEILFLFITLPLVHGAVDFRRVAFSSHILALG